MRKYFLFFILLFSISTLVAQEILTEDVYLELVLANHPVAKQAANQLAIGDAYLLKAKGGFDPKLALAYDNKRFDEKRYFNLLNTYLSIPTYIGADIKLAYDKNDGIYLGAQNTVPDRGLLSAGIEVNVLQGLLFDKRRADLQQAKNYQQMSVFEQIQTLNQLVFDAQDAYWNWYNAYQNQLVQEEGLLLAINRFDMAKKSYQLGDKPAVDTLEALIQIQNREISLQEAQLVLQNTQLIVASFLWFDNETPAVLNESTIPQSFNTNYLNQINQLNDIAASKKELSLQHPKIQQLSFKYDNTSINVRLQKENVKPQLSVQYNFLNEPVDEDYFNTFNASNYKWNIQFAAPLLFRKGRGQLQIAKLEEDNAFQEYTLQSYQQELKIQQVLNKIDNYQNQLEVVEANINNSRKLVDAEKRLFEIGESSLFMVNYREQLLLKLLEKRNALQAKLKIAFAELDFVAGI